MNLKSPTRLYIHGVTSTSVILWLLAAAMVITRFWIPATSLIPVPHAQALQISVLGITLVWMITISPSIRMSRLLAIYLVVAGGSIVANHQADATDNLLRLGAFVGVLFLISPLTVSVELTNLRAKMWRLTWWALRLLVIINYAEYFKNRMVGYISNWGADGFCFSSVWLGILSTLVVLNSFWHLTNNRRLSLARALYHGVLFALAFMLVVASGSRSALIALVLGMFPLIWSMRHNHFRMLLLAVGATAMVGVAFIPQESEGRILKKKTGLWAYYNHPIGSREVIWQVRLSELKSSPFIGVGFCQSPGVAINFSDPKGISEYKNYTTEPGSSWLNIGSTTGLIGLLIMLSFNVRLFFHLWRNRNADRQEFAILLALLLAMWVHACFEGWMLYAGNPKFFFFWLLTAIAYQLKLNPEQADPYKVR